MSDLFAAMCALVGLVLFWPVFVEFLVLIFGVM